MAGAGPSLFFFPWVGRSLDQRSLVLGLDRQAFMNHFPRNISIVNCMTLTLSSPVLHMFSVQRGYKSFYCAAAFPIALFTAPIC